MKHGNSKIYINKAKQTITSIASLSSIMLLSMMTLLKTINFSTLWFIILCLVATSSLYIYVFRTSDVLTIEDLTHEQQKIISDFHLETDIIITNTVTSND